MLGFGALGEFALGEGPFGQARFVGGSFSQPLKRAGLTAAVIATTFAGFVPPPQAQASVFTQFSQPQKKPIQQARWGFVLPPVQAQTAIFASFSQPQVSRVNLPDEQPSTLFEVLPPQSPPFAGFARFTEYLPKKSVVFLYSAFQPEQLFVPAPDTHDLVFMGEDPWRKKKRRTPIDDELARKAKLRADIELAVYGPEVTYEPPPAALVPPKPPLNVDDLAKAILTARAAHEQAQREALLQDDEDVIEMILRDL